MRFLVLIALLLKRSIGVRRDVFAKYQNIRMRRTGRISHQKILLFVASIALFFSGNHSEEEF